MFAGNDLLAALPPDAFARIAPHLELVQLRRKDILFRAHERLHFVYFPVTAVVSLVASLDSGATLEVGLVGRDGLAGTAVLPGIDTMAADGVTQIGGGTAHRMSADVLRRVALAQEPVRTAITCCSDVLLERSVQMLLCNMFHPVEQRCIRWLLAVSDLTALSDIPLTHELLATMLGVRRPTVTLVIRALQRAGLVEEKRGRLTIRDRAGLEAASCECYRSMRDHRCTHQFDVKRA